MCIQKLWSTGMLSAEEISEYKMALEKIEIRGEE